MAEPPAAVRPVVGRFAPSPSGRMHLGNVLCALVAWLSVRSQGGRMVLRMEDLDPARCRPAYARQLLEDLEWLGLDWDEGPPPPGGSFRPQQPCGPYWQSQCAPLYAQALQALEAKGLVYPCYCSRAQLHAAAAPHISDGTPVYPGTCRGMPPARRAALEAAGRRPAARLRVPDAGDPAGWIAFTDRHLGPQRQCLAAGCGDFLLRRSDGVFAYQLAVVVDDGRMGITEVVRGRDLLSSTPRQIYLQRLLGLQTPVYRHIPLLTAPDGRRLSKRERSLDLGALRQQFTAPVLVGRLAAAAGLVPAGTEAWPRQLVGIFSWNSLPQEDIIIREKGWSSWPEKKTRN